MAEFFSPEIFAIRPRIITIHPRACMPPVKRPRGRVRFRSQHAGSQPLLNSSGKHRLCCVTDVASAPHGRGCMIDAAAERWLSGARESRVFRTICAEPRRAHLVIFGFVQRTVRDVLLHPVDILQSCFLLDLRRQTKNLCCAVTATHLWTSRGLAHAGVG